VIFVEEEAELLVQSSNKRISFLCTILFSNKSLLSDSVMGSPVIDTDICML